MLSFFGRRAPESARQVQFLNISGLCEVTEGKNVQFLNLLLLLWLGARRNGRVRRRTATPAQARGSGSRLRRSVTSGHRHDTDDTVRRIAHDLDVA
jgi:hypothetical protein